MLGTQKSSAGLRGEDLRKHPHAEFRNGWTRHENGLPKGFNTKQQDLNGHQCVSQSPGSHPKIRYPRMGLSTGYGAPEFHSAGINRLERALRRERHRSHVSLLQNDAR